MHYCGGLIRRPAMQAQLYNEWANLLVGKGFVVLFPDSSARAGSGRNAAKPTARCMPGASASPMPMRRGAGCKPRATSRPTNFAARLVERRRGSAVDGASDQRDPTAAPISAPPSRSIRAAAAARDRVERTRADPILVGAPTTGPRPPICQRMVAGARPQRPRLDRHLSRRLSRFHRPTIRLS